MKQVLEAIKRPFELPVLHEGESFTIVIPAQRKQEQLVTPEIIASQSGSMQVGKSYTIEVKRYMTQHSSPSFDFMQKFNNDCPMPFVEMAGSVIKETRGMVYMELHGLVKETAATCMRCGRPLTNKVSMLYGLGPECGNHAYINPYSSEEELDEYVRAAREKIRSVTWAGWVIKSAVQHFEEETL